MSAAEKGVEHGTKWTEIRTNSGAKSGHPTTSLHPPTLHLIFLRRSHFGPSHFAAAQPTIVSPLFRAAILLRFGVHWVVAKASLGLLDTFACRLAMQHALHDGISSEEPPTIVLPSASCGPTGLVGFAFGIVSRHQHERQMATREREREQKFLAELTQLGVKCSGWVRGRSPLQEPQALAALEEVAEGRSERRSRRHERAEVPDERGERRHRHRHVPEERSEEELEVPEERSEEEPEVPRGRSEKRSRRCEQPDRREQPEVPDERGEKMHRRRERSRHSRDHEDRKHHRKHQRKHHRREEEADEEADEEEEPRQRRHRGRSRMAAAVSPAPRVDPPAASGEGPDRNVVHSVSSARRPRDQSVSDADNMLPHHRLPPALWGKMTDQGNKFVIQKGQAEKQRRRRARRAEEHKQQREAQAAGQGNEDIDLDRWACCNLVHPPSARPSVVLDTGLAGQT